MIVVSTAAPRLLTLKIQNNSGTRASDVADSRLSKGFRMPRVAGLQLLGQTCDPNPFEGKQQKKTIKIKSQPAGGK